MKKICKNCKYYNGYKNDYGECNNEEIVSFMFVELYTDKDSDCIIKSTFITPYNFSCNEFRKKE